MGCIAARSRGIIRLGREHEGGAPARLRRHRRIRPATARDGSVLPGFHVETAERPRELAIAGGHRFSDYALIFRLDKEDGDRTVLRAETRATFPGLKGSAYRAMVIGTRIHVLVTRRLLSAAKRSAERP